jgi:predicted nucleotidyltransferase
MTRDPLVASELELVLSVLRQHQEIGSATLFGSRAKGTHSDRSDVDLVLAGPLGALGAAAIAAEQEERPLPFRFDVHALSAITYPPLLEHIERVGMVIYPEGRTSDAPYADGNGA